MAEGLNEMADPSGVLVFRTVDNKRMAARFDLNDIRSGKAEDPLLKAGRLPHKSGLACDHFRRYDEDFALLAELGQTSHRLSLEWSRIEPRPGELSHEALDHYRRVLESLRAHGLEPIVTLHHFSNPIWLAEQGG